MKGPCDPPAGTEASWTGRRAKARAPGGLSQAPEGKKGLSRELFAHPLLHELSHLAVGAQLLEALVEELLQLDVVLLEAEAKVLDFAGLVGHVELALVLFLHVGVVGGHVAVADDGIDAAVAEVLHGEAHVVVFADRGADLGLLHDEDAGGADLAADLQALEAGQILDVLVGRHDHGLHDVVVGRGEEIQLLALGRDGRGRGDHVVLAGRDAGEDAVPRHVLDVELDIEHLAQFGEQVDGEAHGFLVGAQEFHGRPGAVAGNADFLAFSHGAAGRQGNGEDAQEQCFAEHMHATSGKKVEKSLTVSKRREILSNSLLISGSGGLCIQLSGS